MGYRAPLGDLFSVTGSAGLGENIQASGSGDNFPYYVLRIGADVKATEDVTWNIITFRYRDGFDPDDNFLTPQVATGLSYDLDEHNSIWGWRNTIGRIGNPTPSDWSLVQYRF